MFGRVAGKYDLANQVLSLGVHHLWRKKVVKASGVKPGQKVLDCATGTGDLAIEFKKAVGSLGEVTGTDFCIEMLGPAPKKRRPKLPLEDILALRMQCLDELEAVIDALFARFITRRLARAWHTEDVAGIRKVVARGLKARLVEA